MIPHLVQRKRKCQICGGKVNLVESLYNSNWNYYKRWFKCEDCSFLQSLIEPDLYEWLTNGSGGVGGIYELGYRQYRLARLLADTFNMDRILIHGAGYTNTLELLLKKKYNVYGCDLVKPTIDLEKKNLGEDRYFHIDNYPKEKFDAIVSVEVFEHLINPLGDTKELLSHLNDGGILCLSTDFLPEGRFIRDRDKYGKARCHVSYWNQKSMDKLAELCGVNIHYIKLHLPDPSPEDPPSMNYNYKKEYPNRLVALMYKDKSMGDKIKLLNDIKIPPHNTIDGITIDHAD